MKKLASSQQKPARAKRGASPRDLFAGMDLNLLRQLLADELALEEESLEDMVDAFLSAQPEALEDMPSAEAMSQLAEELENVRIDANGGDPQARESLKAVRESDPARADAVDQHARPGKLRGHEARQRVQHSLRRAVARRSPVHGREAPSAAAYIDDAPPAPPAHARRDGCAIAQAPNKLVSRILRTRARSAESAVWSVS